LSVILNPQVKDLVVRPACTQRVHIPRLLSRGILNGVER